MVECVYIHIPYKHTYTYVHINIVCIYEVYVCNVCTTG